MKYILVEIPNEIDDEEVESAVRRIRTVVDFESVVRFGSLFTSL